MRQRRFLGLGSAAAAALVIGLVFVAPLNSQSVQAATIFRSLKTTTWQGLRVALERINAEGVHVDGQVEMRFKEPVSLARFIDQCQADCDPHDLFDSAFLRLSVSADESADADLVGLDLDLRGGFARQEGWVFARVASLPSQLLEEEPMALAIAGLLQNGVLLDLGGLQKVLRSLHAPGPERGRVDVQIHKEVEGSLHEAMADVHREMEGLHHDLAAAAHAQHRNAALAHGLSIDGGANPELEQLVRALITGSASADQLRAIASLFEEGADDVTVADLGDGLYVLQASGFGGDDPMLASATLAIRYRSGAGVEALDVSHIGASDGRISIAFVEDLQPRSDDERSRLIEQGVMRIDVSSLVAGLAAFAQ